MAQKSAQKKVVSPAQEAPRPELPAVAAEAAAVSKEAEAEAANNIAGNQVVGETSTTGGAPQPKTEVEVYQAYKDSSIDEKQLSPSSAMTAKPDGLHAPQPVAASRMSSARAKEEKDAMRPEAAGAGRLAVSADFAPPAQTAMVATEGRVFELRDNTWVQQGYANETTVRVERDSVTLRDLAKRDEGLRKLLDTVDAPIIFRADTTWYRIEAKTPGKP